MVKNNRHDLLKNQLSMFSKQPHFSEKIALTAANAQPTTDVMNTIQSFDATKNNSQTTLTTIQTGPDKQLTTAMQTTEMQRTVKPACPRSVFNFTSPSQKTDYVRIKVPVPEFTDISICSWVEVSKTSYEHIHTLLSYATMKSSNTILIEFINTAKIKVTVNGIRLMTHNIDVSFRTFLCFIVATDTKIFVNGSLKAESEIHSKPIPGNGLLVIGQDQDSIGGGFNAHQSFFGIIENIFIWNRALTDEEMHEMHEHKCKCPNDYVISANQTVSVTKGNVIATYTQDCVAP
uniref:C-reactive protein-like isoform X2 n=1 Tax=Styela clava TaxID=7725 RepID=UPI0019395321|nr:C-reactive protein-like isoform X2 [Styela clava]